MSVVFDDNDLVSFKNFMSNRSMFQFAITLVIASHLKQTTTNISETILTPIIDKITNSRINRMSIKLFGIDFFLGKIISNIITFVLIMLMLYIFIKATRIDKKLHNTDKKPDTPPSQTSVSKQLDMKQNSKQESRQEASSPTIKLNI
jgi:large-conductance mechanosensitive channel